MGQASSGAPVVSMADGTEMAGGADRTQTSAHRVAFPVPYCCSLFGFTPSVAPDSSTLDQLLSVSLAEGHPALSTPSMRNGTLPTAEAPPFPPTPPGLPSVDTGQGPFLSPGTSSTDGLPLLSRRPSSSQERSLVASQQKPQLTRRRRSSRLLVDEHPGLTSHSQMFPTGRVFSFVGHRGFYTIFSSLK